MSVETILIDGKCVETLVELLRPGLRAVFVGINPSPVSVETGHYYQGQLGKRFWRRLMEFGIAHDLPPEREDEAAYEQGFGFADVVRRPTSAAADLSGTEIRDGALQLIERLFDLGQPRPAIIFVYAKAAKACETALIEKGFYTFRMPGPYEPKNKASSKLAFLASELKRLS